LLNLILSIKKIDPELLSGMTNREDK
jgi:hypothetical protein